jgi:hypothetical protein
MSEATVNNQLRLAGRTAIVTGAGRGIGRYITGQTLGVDGGFFLHA